MNQTYNPYDNVLQVVQQAADILGYSDSDIEAIKYPERELKVSIPVRMDDGTSHFPRTCKRRNPFPSRRKRGRSPCACRLDDFQMCRCKYPLRRR